MYLHQLIPLVAITSLLLAIIPGVLALSTLKFAKVVKQKLEKDIDTNYLFYDHVRSQVKNPYICNAEDGPYCKFASGTSLEDFVVRRPKEVENKKSEVVSYLDKIRNEYSSKNAAKDDIFVVVTNEVRDSLLGDKKKSDVYVVEVYLNFEDHSVEAAETRLKKPYTFIYDPKVLRGGFNKPTVTPKEQAIQLTYSNIYLPSSQKVFSKYNQKEADKDRAVTEKSGIEPYGVYLFATDTPGEIEFSKPVRVSQFYLRKHNFFAHQRAQKDQQKQTNQIDVRAKGYLKGSVVEDLKRSTYSTTNKWVKVTLNSPITIDKLWIDSNQELDNLILDIEHHEKAATILRSPSDKVDSSNDDEATQSVQLIRNGDYIEIIEGNSLRYKVKADPDVDLDQLLSVLEEAYPELKGALKGASKPDFRISATSKKKKTQDSSTTKNSEE